MASILGNQSLAPEIREGGKYYIPVLENAGGQKLA
tara:strand:+ start:87 stop:191 length:105 start_codon:yes stop_codon:yes gene_type:complete